ncbi:MAG: hypothetical protein AB7J32_10240 [Pseudonocardia sp.]
MDEHPPREPAEPGPDPGWRLPGPVPLAHPPAVRELGESGSARGVGGDDRSAWKQMRAVWAAGGGHGPSPWRRIVRTPRAAAGLGILAAAVLLSPFAGRWQPAWAFGLVLEGWLPAWALGFVALVGLRLLVWLLRVDGLVGRWVPHISGLVVVAALMSSTGPWAWALAASIGVLLAGLVQLPAWRLAAVGAVLVAVSAAGFAVAQYRTAEQIQAQEAQSQLESRGRLGAPRSTAVLPTLLTTIARGETGAVCDALLAPAAQAPFAASVGQPDCAAAVRALAAQVTDANAYEKAQAPRRSDPDAEIDACHLTWRATAPPGPQLGYLTVGAIPGGTTYTVMGFRPC